VSLQQLQKLATALAEGSLNELALTGTAGAGMSTAEKFRVRDQIVERLRDIGVTQEDIMKAQHLWIVVYCSILEQQILYDAFLGKSLPNTDPITELKNAGIQLAKDKEGKDGLPSPGALRKWVTTKGLNDPKINERLDEYERVWTTGTIHNPGLIPFGETPMSPDYGQSIPTIIER
jgi:hypothetical protein